MPLPAHCVSRSHVESREATLSAWEQAERLRNAEPLPSNSDGMSYFCCSRASQSMSSGSMSTVARTRGVRTPRLRLMISEHAHAVWPTHCRPRGGRFVLRTKRGNRGASDTERRDGRRRCLRSVHWTRVPCREPDSKSGGITDPREHPVGVEGAHVDVPHLVADGWKRQVAKDIVTDSTPAVFRVETRHAASVPEHVHEMVGRSEEQ